MKRGEVWWANLPEPVGGRPVVLISRNDSYAIRDKVIVIPVTTRIRNIPVEVLLGKAEGLERLSAANADNITTLPKRCLTRKIATLSRERMEDIIHALFFAIGG